MPEPAKVYQIKISIDDIHPPVWRRVWVSDKSTLHDLHNTIQRIFSWVDYHLHDFIIHDVNYGDLSVDVDAGPDLQDERRVKLRQFNLKVGERFHYEYDFGDGWGHTLVLEKILPREKGLDLPQCIQGKRAGPPEDVGGPYGYEGFLEAIRDPKHDEHDQYMEWIGGEFDPEAFDLEAVNQRLRNQPEGNWPGHVPSTLASILPGQEVAVDPTIIEKLLTESANSAAQSLPLRQDVISFLAFLGENKVTGTQSTGNLPLKAVREVAARFMKPPELDTKIGDDLVFHFRSEYEIWPVYFVHVLADIMGLVEGGSGRRWKVTPEGQIFPSVAPAAQVALLLGSWWYDTNWLIATHYDLFGEFLPEDFNKTVASLLLAFPTGEPEAFEPFVDQIIQEVGWTWTKQEPDYTRQNISRGIEDMIVAPLVDFGVLTAQYETTTQYNVDIQKLASITLTDFGRALLETIQAFA